MSSLVAEGLGSAKCRLQGMHPVLKSNFCKLSPGRWHIGVLAAGLST